jgi:hypothetical protein
MIATADPGAGSTAVDPDLLRLTRGGSAVIPLTDLPGLLGVSPDEAVTAVAAWVDSGDVELWPDLPGGPCVVLSSRAAELLGLVLAEDGDDLKWVTATSGGGARPKQPRRTRETNETAFVRPGSDRGWIDNLPDPRAVDPSEVEDMPAKMRTVGKPSVILGIGVAWPVAPDARGGCGVCHGSKLRPGRYCAWCDHMGAEHLLPAMTAAEKPKAYMPDAKGLAGGNARKTGKAPRRKRAEKSKTDGAKGNSFDLEKLRAGT